MKKNKIKTLTALFASLFALILSGCNGITETASSEADVTDTEIREEHSLTEYGYEHIEEAETKTDSDGIGMSVVYTYDTSNPVWTWSDDYSLAYVTFTSVTDAGVTKTVIADITSTSNDPTCTSKGTITHSATALFEDNYYYDTKTETSDAAGHDWNFDDITWTWSGTESAKATFTCKTDSTHKETVDAVVTDSVTTDAGCETAGVRTYTATATFEGKTFTDTKEDGIDETGHDWDTDNISWEWNGYASATATFRCKNDANHVNVLEAEISYYTEREADCSLSGIVIYTATVELNGTEYTDTIESRTSSKGHEWDTENIVWTWADDNSLALATFTCKNESSHTKTLAATVVPNGEDVEATCYQASITYSAAVTFEGIEYCDYKTVSVAAIAHTVDEETHTCTECGYRDGLELTLNSDEASYTVSGIGDYATYFADESGNYELVLPGLYNGLPVTEIGDNAFQNNTNITSVSFGDNITTIGQYAFSGCTGLTVIDIPDTVTAINIYGFYNCKNVTELNIGKGISTIYAFVFANMTSLTSVVVPGNVKTIAGNGFYGNTVLKSVVFEEGVTTIESSAFIFNSVLQYVILPESCTGLDSYAFISSGLQNIFWAGSTWPYSSYSDKNIYCYSADQPEEEGNFWYYDENGDPAIWA